MLYQEPYQQDSRLYADGLDRVTLPWADGLQARWSDVWIKNPITESIASNAIDYASDPALRGDPENPQVPTAPTPAEQRADRFLDPKELNDQYSKELGLSFDRPTRAGAVDIMVRRKREQLQRDRLLDRQPSGLAYGAASLLTALAASAADPLNVASAFVPIVSEARYGLWAARYGKFAARGLKGAIEGGAGAALVEPIVASTEHAYQGNYSAFDSFLNITMGTVLGGGLHAGFGAISDFISRAKPETREAALRSSVGQMADGRPVEINHILSTDTFMHADHLPVFDPEELRLLSEDARLGVEGKKIDEQLAALPKPDQAAVEGVARLQAVEQQRANPGLSPEERKALGLRRDELLTNTTPEELQARAASSEQRRTLEAQKASNAEQRADIQRRRTRTAADAILGPKAQVADALTGGSKGRANFEALAARVGNDPARVLSEAQRLNAESRATIQQEAGRAIDKARTNTLDQARGAQPSGAVSPQASADAARTVQEKVGDDLETNLADAMKQIDDYEKQGALTPEEAESAKSARDGLKLATQYGKAADAAARCLLLHP